MFKHPRSEESGQHFRAETALLDEIKGKILKYNRGPLKRSALREIVRALGRGTHFSLSEENLFIIFDALGCCPDRNVYESRVYAAVSVLWAAHQVKSRDSRQITLRASLMAEKLGHF